jgi:GT2 family glycosyltransferase
MNKKNCLAVLLTCHNRKEKTVACLTALYNCIIPESYVFEVFLVDDGSTDGTSQAIKEKFPQVHIIKGNGNLYWNQGMRLAWKTAIVETTPDFFLWLNDDTNIDNDSLIHLFECYNEYKNRQVSESIVVGSCRNEIDIDKFSYGLRKNGNIIVPNGSLQNGDFLNGNLVLISKAVYTKLDILSNCYTHAMGDYDYGLRALDNGIELITTKKYIATCESNIGLPKWCDPMVNFFNRWKALHTPLGLNIKEYKIFRKNFWPKNYMMSILKVYLRCLMPRFYNKISAYAK